MKCPICDSASLEIWAETGVIRCHFCNHKFLAEAPCGNPYETDRKLTNKFSCLEVSGQAEALSAARADFALGNDIWSQAVPKIVVDLGCSVGSFLREAQRRGWLGLGFDCSRWAVEEAQSSGLRAQHMDIESLNGDAPMAHVVTMFDVIEHLKDPIKTLKTVAHMLPVGGSVVISTPNADAVTREAFGSWRHFRPSEHLHYFTSRSLASALHAAGLSPDRWSYFESSFRFYPERPDDNILSVAAVKST